jgi:hypothetical protein
LPRGVINAKVEGNIDNSGNALVDSTTPGKAFFAKEVHLVHGPVIPPVVPYQPFAEPTVYHTAQAGLKGLFKFDHVPRNTRAHATKTAKKK